ncbi:hypothetical protein ONZ43_g2336 [Nemania bipapillata]|uniref:Uncharacterized protein n=1 Tax=Nemania bipapillata TaxID=110536 RepID=A0ACC2J127_9PEZI|nr:hypothetical protein ONZ43_g2336 [Nemania bipapillata]
MDQSEAGNVNNWDLPLGNDLFLPMEGNAQHEIIDLDPDDSVQAQHEDVEVSCKNAVLFVFPDICPDYLAQLSLQHHYQSQRVISAILDNQDKGVNYPTKPGPVSRSRKRKRSRSGEGEGPGHHLDHSSDDEDDGDRDPESVRSIKLQIATSEHTAHQASSEYATLARLLIGQDFPRLPQNIIRMLLLGNKKSLFETYVMIDQKIRNGRSADIPWKEKKNPTKINHQFTPDNLPSLDLSTYKPAERAAFAEFIAAREFRAAKDAKIAAEAEEINNFRRAQFEGQTTDCGICFEECPLNRMVRCEGEIMHWFCRKCLRLQAEGLVGMSRSAVACAAGKLTSPKLVPKKMLIVALTLDMS